MGHVSELLVVAGSSGATAATLARYTYNHITKPLSLAVAASRTLRLVCLWPQVDALSLLAWPQVPRAGLVDRQLLRDGSEELLYVLARLRGGLEEQQTGLARVLLGIGGGDGALVGRFGDEIELVSGKGDDDVLVGLALELFDPRLRLVQRCLSHVSSRRSIARRVPTACVMS
jgi:hypothetical protein